MVQSSFRRQGKREAKPIVRYRPVTSHWLKLKRHFDQNIEIDLIVRDECCKIISAVGVVFYFSSAFLEAHLFLDVIAVLRLRKEAYASEFRTVEIKFDFSPSLLRR